MSESLKSFLILLGGLLLVLALWYLSVLAVRHDTRRRLARGEMRAFARNAWIAAAICLPLFGFALYLFQRILHRYMTPAPHPEEMVETIAAQPEVSSPADRFNWPDEGDTFSARQTPARLAPADLVSPKDLLTRTNGNGVATKTNGAHAYVTPATLPGAKQPAPKRYALAALEGPYAGQSFPLDSLPLRIGRGADVALALDYDLNVSRSHAEIYEWNGMLRVHDLGSMHGTLINGIPITDQALTPGDHLALGGTVFMLRELP